MSEDKPKWLKITGLILAVVLIVNILLFSFTVYSELVFWIVLVVFGGTGWILVKRQKA